MTSVGRELEEGMTMFTKHVLTRAQQRSVMQGDLGLVYEFGTMTDRGAVLTQGDIQEAEREAKAIIDRLHKLKNVFVATDGDEMITTFRATKKQLRELVSAG
jgi:hypothetical protein